MLLVHVLSYRTFPLLGMIKLIFGRINIHLAKFFKNSNSNFAHAVKFSLTSLTDLGPSMLLSLSPYFHHYIYLLTASTPINPIFSPVIVEYSILRLNCTFRCHILSLKAEADYFLPLLLHQLLPLHWILTISVIRMLLFPPTEKQNFFHFSLQQFLPPFSPSLFSYTPFKSAQ